MPDFYKNYFDSVTFWVGKRSWDSFGFYPSGFFSVLGHLLGEELHDLGVEVCHEDLDGLVRLHVHPASHVAVQRVQGVEVPAVTANYLNSVWKSREIDFKYKFLTANGFGN